MCPIIYRVQTILTILCICLPCFAASIDQRVYTFREREFRDLVILCQVAGVRYPTVSPVTAGEMISALERIPDNAAKFVIDKRDELIKKLNGEDATYANDVINFDINIYGGLNGLIHSDIDVYEYFVPYRNIDPMLAISLNASFANSADLYIEFMEKDPIMSLTDPMAHWTNFYTLVSIENGEWGFLKHLTQAYQPFKAGLSAGNEWFNFQIARNRQSIGHGVTGNLVVSDNFSYEEYLRMTFISDFFNYYMDVTYFDQQIASLDFETFRLSGNHQLRSIHRFEFTPLDSLVLSFSFVSMFQSDSMFDWRVLVPMMIPHSFNNFSESGEITSIDEANNIMSLDVSWSFLPTWMLHLEVVMDQFQLSYEQKNFMPNGFGFLLNVQNTTVIEEGFLHSYFEGVYTMPYLYLNRAKYRDTDRDYNYDWILGHHFTGGNEIQYSGYPEGPDTIRLTMGSEYLFDFGLLVGGYVDFMMHGIHGIKYNDWQIDTVEENWRSEINIYEYTLALGLSVSYDIGYGLLVGVDVYLPYKWNYKNIEGDDSFIPQTYIYFRYSFL